MPSVTVDVKEIERNYDSAKGNATLGGWLSIAIITAMLISFFSGSMDGSLLTVGFFALGGFFFMWGYNKNQASLLLKKLDARAYSNYHKSYHESYMERKIN